MTKRNSNNARIKRQYFRHKKLADQMSEMSVDRFAASLTLYEQSTGYKDFKKHNLSWPETFREVLNDACNASGNPLSASTKSNHMRHVRDFIGWLSYQQGYKSKISPSDARYYNLSRGEERIAGTTRDPIYPLPEQALKAYRAMPSETEIERRDKNLFGLFLMAGPRVKAMTTLKLKRVDLDQGTITQDARDVETKFSKTFLTALHIIAPDVLENFRAWVIYLYEEKNFGPNDPLFPKSDRALNDAGEFFTTGVSREHWAQTGSIRQIVKNAFQSQLMPAYGPHSFRHMLGHIGMEICPTPRAFKAWSVNFGHSGVMTTFQNYGKLTTREQIEEIKKLSSF